MVPAQDRAGCHDGGDTRENAATEDLALRGESSALVIGEPKASPTESLLQDAVLLNEVFNDLGLVAIDPAGERGEEELEREKVGHGSAIVPVERKVISSAVAVRSNNRTARPRFQGNWRFPKRAQLSMRSALAVHRTRCCELFPEQFIAIVL